MPRGFRVEVHVKPGARETSVEKVGPHQFEVRLKARAEKGEANRELVKLLSKHFGGRAAIVAGFSSRRKLVEVEGATPPLS